MKYEPINFDRLIGMRGFSDLLLKDHFTLYQGYVANTNKLYESLRLFDREEKPSNSEYSEIKRRFGWEFNGMRLHELYFGNMTRNGSEEKGDILIRKIAYNFGSVQDWEYSFKNVGKIRGIGWILLSYDPVADRLFNIWVNEHDGGNLAGSVPLLIMDVFEHAYLADYGLKREEYVTAFFKVIDWRVISERLESVVFKKSELQNANWPVS